MISTPADNAPGPTTGVDAWFSPGRFALLLLLCLAASFPGVIFGDQSFVARDFGLFSYPVAHYQRECFWRGEVPLWNPLHNCGVPFLAQLNTMTLYPLSLIYLLLPLDWSLSVFCLLHLFIAGLGMYFLARHWTGSGFAAALAGMAFAFNGLSLNFLMWPSHVATYAWMPWVIWSVELGWQQGGRRLVWAALAGSMQMLAGGPETILLTWLFLAALWLGQWISGKHPRGAMAGRFLLMGTLVAGLAAAQILPFLDLMAHAQRGVGYAGAGWAMPARGWGSFFVPLFDWFRLRKGIYAQEKQDWTSSYYLGIGVTVLALIALWRSRDRRVWLLGAMALLGVLLAMGQNGFVFPMLKKIVPALGFMNHPIKFVLLTVFAVPLLAAFGLVELRRFTADEPTRARRLIICFGAGTTLVMAALVGYARVHPADAEDWAATAWSGLTRFGILAGTLGVIWLLQGATQNRMRRLFFIQVVALAWLDVITHAPTQNPTAPRAVFQSGLVQLSPPPKHGTSRAYVSSDAIGKMNTGTSGSVANDFLLFRQGLFLNANLLDDTPTIGGFYSLYLKTDGPIRGLLGARHDQGPDPLADFAGISWESDPHDAFKFVARTNYMPMITGGQRPVFAEPTNILSAIGALDFKPREVVYLPPETRSLLAVSNAAGVQVVSSNISAQRIDLEVEAGAPALMVAAQSFYHPWRAFVNGRETPIYRANYDFQAWEVPAGHSRVRLEYRDHWFHFGVMASALSLLACFSLWWFARNGKKEKAAQSGPVT